MADLQKFIDEIEKLTVLEINELVKMLEEKFGVSAAAQLAVAGGAAGGAAAEEEKSEFDIHLKEVGANKIAVIKIVRELTGLGLGESKALVDGAPNVLKEKVATEEAKTWEEKFKEAGAVIELK